MKILTLIICVMMCCQFLPGEKVAEFPDLNKATSLAMDETQLYISEAATVRIYSLKDYKLITTFGSAGNGPREFRVMPTLPLLVTPRKDDLVINSVRKLSIFKKDGTYIKEKTIRIGFFSATFLPIKDDFIGMAMVGENNQGFYTVNLYDSEFNKKKELGRGVYLTGSGKIDLMRAAPIYRTLKDKIIFTLGEKFEVSILDSRGDLLHTIKRQVKPIEFTKHNEEELRGFLKLAMGEQYERLKNLFAFPKKFPVLLDVQATENFIYILTWKKKGENHQVFVYDIKGKFIKEVFVPFSFTNGVQPSPYLVKGGKLYQVVENEDTEIWELHVQPIN